MKNYLKFVIVIFGVTVALFSSANVFAGPTDQDPDGGCEGSTGKCGETDAGKIIVGEYK